MQEQKEFNSKINNSFDLISKKKTTKSYTPPKRSRTDGELGTSEASNGKGSVAAMVEAQFDLGSSARVSCLASPRQILPSRGIGTTVNADNEAILYGGKVNFQPGHGSSQPNRRLNSTDSASSSFYQGNVNLQGHNR